MGFIRVKTVKIRASLLAILTVCLVHQVAEATVALTIGTLALTAAQTTALAGLGALVAAKGVALGFLAGRAKSSRSRSRYRGKRSFEKQGELDELLEEELISVDVLAALGPDQCFKRVFCSAATGSLNNPSLEKTLNLVVEAMEVDPANPNTNKFREAALFGATRRSIEKCEFHYSCPLNMDTLTNIFA